MGVATESNFTHVPMFGDAIHSIHTVLIVFKNNNVPYIRSFDTKLAEE